MAEHRNINQNDGPDEPQEAVQGTALEENPENTQVASENQGKKKKRSGPTVSDVLIPILIVLAVGVALSTGLAVAWSLLIQQTPAAGTEGELAGAPPAQSTPFPWSTGEMTTTFSVFRDKGLLSQYPRSNTPNAGNPSAAPQAAQSGGSWGDSSITDDITGDLSRTAYWVDDGMSYHFSSNCPSLARSTSIHEGTLQDALNAGKTDPCNNCANGI